MMRHSHSLKFAAAVVVAAALATLAGCAVQSNGMTLPSPYYQKNDVQYFPKGPEFIHAREAAQLETARAEQ